ncbi:uncharacterized protein LOC114723403 [Neltuma alba]|uniref:uncharacterized protein LOC114723403 n=1 Tax=Neltuma alba TaxID=207710 RepID=UPI0010A2DB7A|nr:uncharacterized protein LOC114723403 [Prosopis alba]
MAHPWHPHPLRLNLDEEEKRFKCSGCKEHGLGPRYQCAVNCPFVLHELCFNVSPDDPPRTHEFMGNCEFQFLRKPPGGPNRRLCDACGCDIRGFLYHDMRRNVHDLHPRCLNLKRTISDPDSGMKLKLKDKVPSNSVCDKCKRKDLNVATKGPFRGWCYASSCGNYCYHVFCLKKKLILDNWERGYFNVASSSSSSSLVVRTGRSSRNTRAPSDGSLVTSAPRPSTSYSTPKGLFPVAMVFLAALISLYLSENPVEFFKVFADVLVKVLPRS